MPRVIGIPPCRGAFGTLVYYYMNGRWYVRSRAIISKESIMTKPSRKRHRENMTEFGFASHVARKIREAWGQSGTNATGPYTSGRFNKEMLALLKASEGTRGQRSVQLTTQGHRLEGFEFDEGRNPDTQFTHTPTVTTEYEGDQIRIHLKFPRQARHNRRKTGAKNTHYTLYLNAVVISDHHAHTEDNHPETHPADRESAVYTATAQSEPLEIAKDDRLPNLVLEMQAPIHPEQTILISYGLKYHQQKGEALTTPERGSPRSKITQHDAYMRILKAEGRPASRQRMVPERSRRAHPPTTGLVLHPQKTRLIDNHQPISHTPNKDSPSNPDQFRIPKPS